MNRRSYRRPEDFEKWRESLSNKTTPGKTSSLVPNVPQGTPPGKVPQPIRPGPVNPAVPTPTPTPVPQNPVPQPPAPQPPVPPSGPAGYQQSQNVKDAYQKVEDHKKFKPGDYVSGNKPILDELLKQLQNREFDYDPSSDAMYQQALDNYISQGKLAMEDTVGQLAALTGGYGNSYAQTAGQQAYHGYLKDASGLAAKYQAAARSIYDAEGDDLMREYALMNQKEQEEYDKWQDSLRLYLQQQSDLQNRADREAAEDYNRFMQNQQWQHQLEQESIANKDMLYKKIMIQIQNGYMPSDKELEDAGMSKEEAKAYWDRLYPSGAQPSGSSGSGRYKDTNPVQEWKDWLEKQGTPYDGGAKNSGGGKKPLELDKDSVLGLGSGPLSGGYVRDMVDRGDASARTDENAGKIYVDKVPPKKKPGLPKPPKRKHEDLYW